MRTIPNSNAVVCITAMRNDLPHITESASELREKIDATPRKRMKQRLEALFLIKSGECGTRDTVAATLGVHRHTITRWLTKYEEGGISELLEIRTRPNRKRVVPDHVYNQLGTVLRDRPEQFSSYRDVQAWLRKEFNLEVKYKTLYRLVRYELGIDVSGTNEVEEVVQPTVKVIPARTVPTDPEPKREQRQPTVANFFRGVASMLEESDAGADILLDAVSAAKAILGASPPYGEFTDRAQTHVPKVGREIRNARRNAGREIDVTRLSLTDDEDSVIRTRDLLYRLADELDQNRVDDSRLGSRTTYVPPLEDDVQSTDEPSGLFFSEEDDFDYSDVLENRGAVPEEFVEPTTTHGAGTESADNWTLSTVSSDRVVAEYLVLFADDDDITASIVKRQLGKQSAALLRATSAAMAVEFLAKHPVDLIVVSTKLGNESGLTLLSDLRHEPAFDHIPIVVVGWPEDVENDADVKRRGADAYLEKPFSPNAFTSTVMRLLLAARASVQRREDRVPTSFVKRATDARKTDASSY